MRKHASPCNIDPSVLMLLLISTIMRNSVCYSILYLVLLPNLFLSYLISFHVTGSNTVELGIDLSEFYMSVEWDILEVPAIR